MFVANGGVKLITRLALSPTECTISFALGRVPVFGTASEPRAANITLLEAVSNSLTERLCLSEQREVLDMLVKPRIRSGHCADCAASQQHRQWYALKYELCTCCARQCLFETQQAPAAAELSSANGQSVMKLKSFSSVLCNTEYFQTLCKLQNLTPRSNCKALSIQSSWRELW